MEWVREREGRSSFGLSIVERLCRSVDWGELWCRVVVGVSGVL